MSVTILPFESPPTESGALKCTVPHLSHVTAAVGVEEGAWHELSARLPMITTARVMVWMIFVFMMCLLVWIVAGNLPSPGQTPWLLQTLKDDKKRGGHAKFGSVIQLFEQASKHLSGAVDAGLRRFDTAMSAFGDLGIAHVLIREEQHGLPQLCWQRGDGFFNGQKTFFVICIFVRLRRCRIRLRPGGEILQCHGRVAALPALMVARKIGRDPEEIGRKCGSWSV